MSNALSVTPVFTDIVTLPLVGALVVAAVVLVAIAARMRHLRTAGNLTMANASVGGASAALVVAATILASMSLGTSIPASALTGHVGNAGGTVAESAIGQSHEPIVTNELEGFQLPTE